MSCLDGWIINNIEWISVSYYGIFSDEVGFYKQFVSGRVMGGGWGGYRTYPEKPFLNFRFAMWKENTVSIATISNGTNYSKYPTICTTNSRLMTAKHNRFYSIESQMLKCRLFSTLPWPYEICRILINIYVRNT